MLGLGGWIRLQIIAIDGPAGSGKSSVSKAAAQQLGFGYLDTGAAYRALTWAEAKGLIDCSSATRSQLQRDFQYSISLDPGDYWVKVGNIDVTEEIRTVEIGKLVSRVAAFVEVRKYMKELTRDLVVNSRFEGVIVEGRDITTVIFPDAQIRILLTATEEVRLRRRSAELPSDAAVSDQISQRDKEDSKVVDFMVPAAGVTLLDTSDLNFAETVAAVVKLVDETKA
ncbi:MAG: (d)CMP kinase [Actinobacteria bacterium]|nr:(d)CMP kinase [Actinomycetota bacterium]NBT46211.1 (d)CMP kinase [Actinomycetota bacterium]NBY43830.1 (d)CMP kinase [Micrococcales bacterium]